MLTSVAIVDANTFAPVARLAAAGVVDICFSPAGTYMCTWERYIKPDTGTDAHKNVRIWDAQTGAELGAFAAALLALPGPPSADGFRERR